MNHIFTINTNNTFSLSLDEKFDFRLVGISLRVSIVHDENIQNILARRQQLSDHRIEKIYLLWSNGLLLSLLKTSTIFQILAGKIQRFMFDPNIRV